VKGWKGLGSVLYNFILGLNMFQVTKYQGRADQSLKLADTDQRHETILLFYIIFKDTGKGGCDR
jgi:hypothetical protein